MRCAVTLILLFASAVGADPYDEFARTIKADEVFYRWQSTIAGENMLNAGILTPSLDRYFMNHEGAAGGGLYIAGSETSSAAYLPSKGGNMIEVRIAEGTKLVDLSDTETIIKLEDLGHDIYAHLKSNHDGKPIVFKYQDDWFVAKHLENRVTFRPYPGPTQTPESIAAAMTKVHEGYLETESAEAAANQIARQVIAHRPELLRAVTVTSEFHPAFLRALPVAEAAALLRQSTAQGVSHRAAGHLVRYLAPNAAARKALAQDAPTFDRVADAIVDHAVPRLGSLTAREIKLLEALTVASKADAGARIVRLNRVFEEVLDSRLAKQDPAWTAARLKPFIAHATLSAEQRALLRRHLNQFAKANPDATPAEKHAVEVLREASAQSADPESCVAHVVRAR